MSKTIIEQLAEFTTQTQFDQLPPAVLSESKRAILDSIGVAVAAVDHPKGRAGINYGKIVGRGSSEATIMGTGERVSVYGAAFANAELINALDMCVVTPPGHVTPYVLPGALAEGEVLGSSGKELIVAMAVSHEMSVRFAKALVNQRDTVNGKAISPKVFGNASGIFGATAAIGRMKMHSTDTIAHALGIAAYISPVNSQVSWFKHLPSSTLKYIYAGMLVQQALTAAYSAEVEHVGDQQVLDDAEYGYAAFIGSPKWEPEHLTARLGSDWRFPAGMAYKPYPHCRVWHAALDLVFEIVRENNLKPDEIESLTAYVEAIAKQPVWLNRKIARVQDAQFSMPHGLATAAHLIPPGKAWQDPAVVYSESVMRLMDRVTTHADPSYVKLLEEDPASRPARVEIRARGQLFAKERRYPKGSPSPDASSFMTDAELAQKFSHNCEGVLSRASIDRIVNEVMNLERVENVATIARLMGPESRG
ncbi:MAG TPA: MmgE/PrpD family protein [Ramlibacter sp.]|nr:MmgE/PrpD family protein [Ramlibacter sp.]